MSGRFYIDDNELDDFVRKVLKLRAEGLSVPVIAERIGVPRTTINERLRRHRERVARAQAESDLANVAERQTRRI